MTDESTKIIYICGGRNFHQANPGRKIYEVVKCWRDLGVDVQHVCGGDLIPGVNSSESGGDRQRPGKSWWRTRLPAAVNSVSEYRDMQHDKLLLDHLRQMSDSDKPRLIWERSARLHTAGQQYVREIGVPWVLEWKDHLINYRWSLFHGRAITMEKQKNQTADRVVVESNVLKQQLADSGVDSNKILVAHNAIDPEEFRPDAAVRQRMRAELGASDTDILAGYLGSYSFYHNTETLVEAASLVKNPNLKFLLIGDGLELQQCRQRARETGVLDRNLSMLPRIRMQRVPDFLCALDIAILPGSTDIICPIKIQEYMASGTATIAPDYECNREVISDPRLGVLFSPGDSAALAESIVRLANDHQTRSAIAESGRQHVAGKFTWPATWGCALQQVLNEFGHRSA